MSFLGKMFKKHDEFDFDELAEKEAAASLDHLGLDQPDLGLEEKSPFPETRPTPTPRSSFQSLAPQRSEDKELELINSKLDTIRAMLVSLEQRLANIERNLGNEQKQKLW